jgi:phenylacetate-CoA ligase
MHGLISLYQLSRSQWWSAEKLARHRDTALAALVCHAYDRVPYYRSLFDKAGVRPADIRTSADLARIPVTTKRDLQALSTEEKTARGWLTPGCRTITTSGATGIPLEVVLSAADRGRVSASFLCVYRAWGIGAFDRSMAFETRLERLHYRSWYERAGIFRRHRVSALDAPGRWIEAVRDWNPRLLQGHAPTLKLFASAARAAGEDLHVPVIVSTGGWLDSGGRRMLEEVFHARVVDVYASAEAGVMAWECPACDLHHVNEDLHVLELLNEGRPVAWGEPGNVVITVLNAYVMPLIRYDHGDLAVLANDKPACGRALPLLRSVLGRANDFIVLPSGRRLTPHPIFVLMDTTAGVGEWQMIQQADYSLDVTVVAAGSVRVDMEQTLSARLRQMLGDSLVLRFQCVERIQRDPMQKMRCIISHAPGGKGNPDILT